jgi:hypothetical protein
MASFDIKMQDDLPGGEDPLTNVGIDRKATMGAVMDAMREMHKKIEQAVMEFTADTGMEPEFEVSVERCTNDHHVTVVMSKASLIMKSERHES